MSSTLTRLNVALTLTTGAFRRSTQSAIKSAEVFGNKLKSSMLSPLGAISAGLSVAGLTAGVARASERIDALAKSADRLGVTTQSLAGMRLAAKDAGVETEQLEQAMTKLSVKVGQAAAGNKQAEAAFQSLGLSVSDLSGMSADKQFAAISDAIKGLESPAQRTAAAVALLGDEGAKMVNALAIGSKDLAKAGDEASKLGLALSRVDAAKVEESNRSFARIQMVMEGAFNVAAVKLAPIINLISEYLVNASKETGGFGTVMDSVISWGVKIVGFLADAWSGLEVVFRSLRVGVYWYAETWLQTGNTVVKVAQTIGVYLGRAWDAIKAGADVLFSVLKVGWTGAKIPVYDFVEFVGGQLASLLRMTSEAVMRFDIEAGTAMLSAANAVQVAVGDMGATARKDFDESMKGLSASSAKAMESYRTLFSGYQAEGSQFLAGTAAGFRDLAAEESAAIAAIVDGALPSDRVAAAVDAAQAASQSRAEARAAEVTDAQNTANKIVAIDEEAIRKKIENAEEEARRKKEREQLLAQEYGKFMNNLSVLQQSHSKRARAIGEAAAKTKIATDTASAAMASYSALAGIPIVGPALGAAAAAAAIAAGVVQINNVGKNSIGGGGSPNIGGPGSSIGPAAPAQPSQTLVLQGDYFSPESLARIFREAKEKGYIIDEVRRA
jgi:hypothetical protein